MAFHKLYNQTKSTMYLIGEHHGTKEMPQALINILEEALMLDKCINLFLEFPSDIQNVLDDYIKDKVSYKEFLKTEFYNPPKGFYDGRTSKSMFEVIVFAKEHKDRIKTYFIVGKNGKKYESNDGHELAMCDNVCDHYDGNKLNFIYVGSFHAITHEDENDWCTKYYKDNNYLPCGIHLKEKFSNVISIKIESLKGKSIACFGDVYNPETIRVKYVKDKSTVKKDCNIFIKENNKAYDYYYYLKRVTPSYKLK